MTLGKQSFACFSGSLRTFYNTCALSLVPTVYGYSNKVVPSNNDIILFETEFLRFYVVSGLSLQHLSGAICDHLPTTARSCFSASRWLTKQLDLVPQAQVILSYWLNFVASQAPNRNCRAETTACTSVLSSSGYLSNCLECVCLGSCLLTQPQSTC